MQAAVSKHAASVKAQQQATEAASAAASLARQVMQLIIMPCDLALDKQGAEPF